MFRLIKVLKFIIPLNSFLYIQALLRVNYKKRQTLIAALKPYFLVKVLADTNINCFVKATDRIRTTVRGF